MEEVYKPTSEEVLKGESGDSPFIPRDETTNEDQIPITFRFSSGGELPLDHFSQAAYLARTFGGETVFPHAESPGSLKNGHRALNRRIAHRFTTLFQARRPRGKAA